MITKKTQKNDPTVKALREKKLNSILWGPRITEKGTMVAEHQVYTFNISPAATKTEVYEAVKVLYKVTQIRVNILNRKAKAVTVRGKNGTKSAGRKAYVFLKKGDKIEFV